MTPDELKAGVRAASPEVRKELFTLLGVLRRARDPERARALAGKLDDPSAGFPRKSRRDGSASKPAIRCEATAAARQRSGGLSGTPLGASRRANAQGSGNASVKSPPRRIVSPTTTNATRVGATSRCLFSTATPFFTGTIFPTVT
jgi:hypothetical protein